MTGDQNIANSLYWADSCNFNNVYSFILARSPAYIDDLTKNAITNSQKSFMLSKLNVNKVLTCEPVILNPVIMYCKLGLNDGDPAISDTDNTKLRITLKRGARTSESYLKNELKSIISAAFDQTKATLATKIDVDYIYSEALKLVGVEEIKTVRTDTGKTFNGVSLTVWNPAYTGDVEVVTATKSAQPFQVVYYYDLNSITDSIEIVDSEKLLTNSLA